MSTKISVLTPSVRPLGLEIVAKTLLKQTFKNWEWLICGPEKNRKAVKKVIGDIVPYTYLGNGPLKKGQFWDLNHSYNKLFKKAQGWAAISLQDGIYLPPTALERFLEALEGLVATEKTEKVVISGVGDQYERLGQYGKPEIKNWGDPRKTKKYGSLYCANWNDGEFNYAILPKKLIFEIGGFDEEMDYRCRGVDAIQVMERLDAIGCLTFLDQSNESFSIQHGRESYGGEKAWNDSHGLFMKGKSGLSIYDERKEELKKSGKWPHLDYL